MSKLNSFLTLFAAAVIVGVPAYAQEDYRSEVTVQGMGSFTKETTHSGIKQDASKDGGILVGYRRYFTKHLGYGDYVLWQRQYSRRNAETVARLLEDSTGDPNAARIADRLSAAAFATTTAPTRGCVSRLI